MDHDWIQLHSEPIEIGPVVEFVTDSQAGGIALFLGTTRMETNDDRPLIALDYSAYADMAVSKMRDLAVAARARLPIRRLVILHRIGRVAIGQASVVIAVSTPHRADAFDACRALIDQLKAEVPIWKREIWADGTNSWVHPAEGVVSRS